MVIGFDTGFFVKFIEGNREALSAWGKIIEGEEGVVSCLTLFELELLSLRGRIKLNITKTLLEIIQGTCKIIWLDSKNILSLGAKLSHSLGIPTVDSLILAGFIISDVNIIYTTDSDFEAYKRKEVKIVKL